MNPFENKAIEADAYLGTRHRDVPYNMNNLDRPPWNKEVRSHRAPHMALQQWTSGCCLLLLGTKQRSCRARWRRSRSSALLIFLQSKTVHQHFRVDFHERFMFIIRKFRGAHFDEVGQDRRCSLDRPNHMIWCAFSPTEVYWKQSFLDGCVKGLHQLLGGRRCITA